MRKKILWQAVFLLAGFVCLLGFEGACLDDAGSFAELPTAPIVVWHSPVRGEALSVNGAIELVFDREMDRDAVEDAFSIEPRVDGLFEWVDRKTVRFLPLSSLERDTEYVVTVGEAATDTEGISLSDAYTFRFRTVGYLQVTQVIPAPGTEEIEADSTFTVMFNRPVVPLLAVSDPRREALPTPLSFEPAIEGTGEWLNTSIYVFTPSAPLSGGTLYTARVPAGLTDPTGWLLTDDVVWTVTTQSPEVVWHYPSEDADQVVVDTAIGVTFNMPIDLESAQERFTLRKASLLGGLFPQRVEGTLEIDGRTLRFRPAEWLAFDQHYVVSLEAGMTSATGGAGMAKGVAWQFKTVPLPRILSTEPRNGEQEADPYTSFAIRFNTAIDPEMVLENVTIEPAVPKEEIDGYFRFWNNTCVVYFGARPSTDYVVHIGPEIADRYGNRTGQALSVRFRTRALDPMIWLQIPGPMGTYSAYEPARIVAASLNTEELDLTLYRLTLEEYLAAQGDWPYFEPPKEGRLRHWTVVVEAPLNEVKYTPVDLCKDGNALPPGAYYLELQRVGFSTRQRHLFTVSAVNLTFKSDANQVLMWATDLDSGAPISGLPLVVYGEDGEPQAQGATDADGTVLLPVSGGSSRWHGLTVVGEEPFVVGNTGWSEGISPWAFGFDSEIPPENRAHVYTDRPIYRPGQTVYFKGVLRSEDDARYQLCRCGAIDGAIDVAIYDPAWESVYEETLRMDEYGVFTGEVTLSEGASLGTYRIEATLDGDEFRASFQVAAYRPPEFEVLVTPEKSEIGRGEATWADVNVRYFFGGPVVGAPVEWRIFASPYRFRPSSFERYTFTDVDDPWICWDCWWWSPGEDREVVPQGAGITDAEGRLEITLPSEMTGEATDVSSDSPDARVGSRTLTIEATATGSDGQVLSGRAAVIDHRGAFYVGLVARKTIGRAGEALGIDVVTVDWDAVRLPDQALDYVVYRREWVNTYIENEAGTGGSWTWETEDIEVARGTLETDANAEGTFDFIVPEGGLYKVVVRGRDQRERVVQSSLFVWASGETSVSWRRADHDRLTLISDKGAYVPGETAEILIPSPFEGEHWALITVERGTIRRHEVVRLLSNSTVYRLPIEEADAPNIYVSAVIVQGRQAALLQRDGAPAVASTKVGYVALEVEPIRQTLHIDVTPSSEQALPGDRVNVAIRVTDDRGEPVETSLSLDVVDKAILTLQPRAPNGLLEAFYGRRGLGVSTASGLLISINRLVQEQIEDMDAVYTDGRQKVVVGVSDQTAGGEEFALGGVAGQLPAGLTLREQFEETAYWNGAVVTDVDGMAQLTVDLPDNLTTWVVRSVGVTQQTQIGEATTELLVTKPLLVRPVAPRFFVVDDRVELAAVVNNNTEQTLLVDVTIGYTGLVLDDAATKLVRIPAAGEVKVTWWATVEDVPQVDLAFSVVSGSYSDAARPRLTTGPDGTLLVYRYTAPEIVGTAGQLVGEDSRTEVIALPPKYDDRAGELSVRLDPSLAAAMQEGLDYLEHFEYECTEQVVSRFLPNVLTYRALTQLGTDDPELAEKLPRLVEEGVSKLSARQNSDGGWGWWAIDESSPTLTAYVVFAFDKAREADFEIDEDMLARGLDCLVRRLVPSEDLDTVWRANRQAWMLYVLAEAGRTAEVSGYASDLFADRERLSHYARAYLALALQLIRPLDPRIQTLLSDLQNEAILSATGTHWEEEDYDWWAMNTDTRSTAIILDALVRLDPGNALIPNVVRWLMIARRDGIWETTQETAWALIALTDWMVLTGELGGDYDYGVRLNGNDLASGRVTSETVREAIQLSIASSELVSEGENRLTLFRGPGEGRLYYTAHLNVYLPVDEIEPLDRGIVVQRQYLPMGCSSSETACEQITSAAVGETIQVTLTIIAPHDLYYVVVEDPLPAGCEAVDTSLATTSLLDLEPGLFRETEQPSPFWRSFYQWYSRSEMRDEKVVLFADYLPAGTYTYQYTFRATQTGEYHVIPTTAYEFYFPEVFGRADGRLFTVTGGEEVGK